MRWAEAIAGSATNPRQYQKQGDVSQLLALKYTTDEYQIKQATDKKTISLKRIYAIEYVCVYVVYDRRIFCTEISPKRTSIVPNKKAFLIVFFSYTTFTQFRHIL